MRNAFDEPFLGMTGEVLRKQIAVEQSCRPDSSEPRSRTPQTAAASANMLHLLASAMHQQGRLVQAEDLYKKAIALIDQSGEHHFRLSAYLYNLCGLYIQIGRYQEAETLLLRSLQISEKYLGPTNTRTLKRKAALGKLRARIGASSHDLITS
jgi:tetratricopeptide (TPR) repeat protein